MSWQCRPVMPPIDRGNQDRAFGRKGDLPKVSLGRNRTRIQPSFAELLRLSRDILVTAHVTLLLDLRQLRKWPLRSLGCSHLVAKRTHRNAGQSSQELSGFSDGVLERGGDNGNVGGTEQKTHPDLLHGVPQSLGFKTWGSIPVRHRHGPAALVFLLHGDNFRFLCTHVRGASIGCTWQFPSEAPRSSWERRQPRAHAPRRKCWPCFRTEVGLVWTHTPCSRHTWTPRWDPAGSLLGVLSFSHVTLTGSFFFFFFFILFIFGCVGSSVRARAFSSYQWGEEGGGVI